MSYDILTYRAALEAVSNEISEMNQALAGLEFEHGKGGISSRATHYLGELNQASDRLITAKAEVAKLIAASGSK